MEYCHQRFPLTLVRPRLFRALFGILRVGVLRFLGVAERTVFLRQRVLSVVMPGVD